MMNTMDYNEMSNVELATLSRKYSKILETTCHSENAWKDAYKEYSTINAILDERYRAENEYDFKRFYNEHISGRDWEEIDPEAWDYYSDWHKDMYGFRPRHT